MIYSQEQKELLEYIASTNSLCAPPTIIRKIMEIVHLDVIEFNRKKTKIIFHCSITGDDMIPQRFIQCLVVLDKLEKDNLIFIEKGNLSIPKYIGVSNNIELKSKIGSDRLKSEPEKTVSSFCHKFYDTITPRPIQRCGMRKTNAYKLVLKYASAIIYPSPELLEFVENGFKTPEQARFEKQLEIERSNHNITINWTRYTLIAAIIVPLLVCVIEKFSEPILGFLSYIFLRMLFV